MKAITFTTLFLFSTASFAASILGTARHENGTTVDLGDGTFPQYCGERQTARITAPDGTQTLGCYFDNGHVVTITPILKNSTSSLILGALAGQQRGTFRLGPPFTLPSSAVAWSSPEGSGWFAPTP